MYKSGKRDRDRDMSPIGSSKRSRSTLGRYEDDDIRRGSGRSRSPSYRSYGEEYPRGSSSASFKDTPAARPYPYKVLCISSLHPKASDEVIRESVYREFKRYGEISVKIVHEPDERVAYVYFRSYEDARDAKHCKSRIMIYDRPVIVEAAYESASAPSSSTNYGGSGSSTYKEPPRDPYRRSGGIGGYERGHGGRDEPPPPRSYSDRGYPPPPHHHPPAHQPPPPYYPKPDYRREPLPHPPHHHYPPPPPHHPHDPYMRGPPPPHYNPNPRYNGPPRHHPGPPPGSGERVYENKKDKFPNYLHHIPPEDDPLATRTLFAGNLEVNITDEELRRIFARFGVTEDIDIKRPPPGTGNAYAFVRFVNLDMAAKAKQELSGQYIGKFQCKIGYGKANPTQRIWIGGLGSWTTLSILERELDRFGSIKKIEWQKGDVDAYITFETIDAAAAAVKDLRGYPLGGPERRIRTDFADAGGLAPPPGGPLSSPQGASYNNGPPRDYAGGDNNGSGGGYGKRGGYRNNVVLGGGDDRGSRASGASIASSPGGAPSPAARGGVEPLNGVGGARSIAELLRKASVAWNGALILKNSSFSSDLYLIDGGIDGVEGLMKDEDEKNKLRITQRLRLEESKLEDVNKRLVGASSFAVFLAQSPAVTSPLSTDGSSSQIRSHPLKNLISYLKQKDAAGVITLSSSGGGGSGVLYAFPPCEFAEGLLTKAAPELKVDPERDTHFLVVVVIRG